MSDPFNDPSTSPWTRDGDRIDLSKPSGGPAWGQPPPPSDQGGWQQPPPPPDQSLQQPPAFGQQPPPFGQQGPPPQGYGDGQFGQNPYGQPPFGPPPSKGSGNKVLFIILGVVALIVVLVIVAAIAVFTLASDGVGQVVDGFEEFSVEGADIPEAPRLLETSGTISGFDGTETFEFTVSDRTRVQIDVIGRGGLDPIVELFSGRDQIGRDDDGGDGFNSQLTLTLDSGTYTVEVTGFAGDEGSFDLIVSDL